MVENRSAIDDLDDARLQKELDELFEKKVDEAYKKAMRFLGSKDLVSKSEKYIYSYLSKNRKQWDKDL
jgi:hypothetical protein